MLPITTAVDGTRSVWGTGVMSWAVFSWLAVAVWCDLKSRRIPNALPLVGVSGGVAWALWSGGGSAALASVAGAGLAAALLLPGYLWRFTGGGDVKFAAALGAVLGSPAGVLLALFLALMVAAVWAIVAASVAAWRRGAPGPCARYAAMWQEFLTTGTLRYRRPARGEALAVRIPLVPALALGGAGALFLPS